MAYLPGKFVWFYTQALGFADEDMDICPGAKYHVLKDGPGKMRAGIVQQEDG